MGKVILITPKSEEEIVKEFENIRFVKDSGCCFKCCDYKGMHIELKSLLLSSLQSFLLYAAERALPFQVIWQSKKAFPESKKLVLKYYSNLLDIAKGITKDYLNKN